MPFRYPYSNFHELNLDWVMQKISELEAKFTSEVRQQVAALVARLFVDIVYDEETETISFSINEEE